MGKKSNVSPFNVGKGKGKGTTKGVGQGKKNKKPISQDIAPKQVTHSVVSGSATPELPQQMSVIHEIDESNLGEDLASRRKRG